MNKPVQVASESNADQMVSLTEVFHRINKLIPESQNLEIISPKTLVIDALGIMDQNHFSQLPVVAGEEVLGIFSYRSFARKAIDFSNEDGKINLSDMTVDEFIEDVNFVHIKDDLDRTFEPFAKKDVVLVGHPEQLQGILSPLDLASYLYKIALPFLLLAEIELVLRRIIDSCLSPAELQESATKILGGAYSDGNIPTELGEMTFNDLILLISYGHTWQKFEPVFGVGTWHRKRVQSGLAETREIRNDVFHFRRELERADIAKLLGTRDWLKMKAIALEARIEGK